MGPLEDKRNTEYTSHGTFEKKRKKKNIMTYEVY